MLHVEHVSVTLGGRKVLQDVSFSLPAGAFCGLIGANGSGKTTLLRSILGLRTPDSGRISVNGAQGRSALASLGYVPQKTMLDPELPLRARDLVSLGLDGNRLGLPFPSAAKTRLVDKMLHEVDAQDFADQRVGRLSGGQQQRVLIAHALVRQPKILLLDEPLANLDLRSVAEIVALLHRLVAQQNICVLLSAHDMNPLLPVMDRIVYLANGKAVSGTTGEVVRTSVLSALYGYHIDVIRVHGRVLVVAGHEQEAEIGPHHAAHVTEIP